MEKKDYTKMGGSGAVFLTTHWSLIEAAGSEETDPDRSLIGLLMEQYWRPVYCYLRRKGYDNEQAKDLTQGFFHEMVLGHRLVEKADAAKGRFRTYLLTALNRYVVNVHNAETARNAAIHAERQDWPLNRVVEALGTARSSFLAALGQLPQEAFSRPRRYPGTGESQTSVEEWTVWRARHDAAHTADLTAWREATLERRGGSKVVLLATLAAARQALLSAAALVPPAERASTPVCGIWTLQDLMGHVADWEQVGVEGLRQAIAGRPLGIEPVTDFDPWNQAHAEVRKGQSWDQVWADFHTIRQALVDTLKEMNESDLGLEFSYPWGGGGTACHWVRIFLNHDQEFVLVERCKDYGTRILPICVIVPPCSNQLPVNPCLFTTAQRDGGLVRTATEQNRHDKNNEWNRRLPNRRAVARNRTTTAFA